MDPLLPKQIGLKLPDHPDQILEYTNQIIQALSDHITLNVDQKRRIKLIIVELVTNSIKHSTDPASLLRLTINHPTLTIEKVDVGLQIKFEGAEQLPFEEVDRTINVTMANRHNYIIKILSPYTFKFVDAFKEFGNLENMPEHFGFYIITMASDNFEYHHDPDSKENTFIVDINL